MTLQLKSVSHINSLKTVAISFFIEENYSRSIVQDQDVSKKYIDSSGSSSNTHS